MTRSFCVFFDLPPNKRLSKQSWGWWFETPSCPYDVTVMFIFHTLRLSTSASRLIIDRDYVTYNQRIIVYKTSCKFYTIWNLHFNQNLTLQHQTVTLNTLTMKKSSQTGKFSFEMSLGTINRTRQILWEFNIRHTWISRFNYPWLISCVWDESRALQIFDCESSYAHCACSTCLSIHLPYSM